MSFLIPGFAYALGALTLPFVILKVGRVKLLLLGLGTQAATYLIVVTGLCFGINWFIPMGIYLFEFTFTLSVGGILYVYTVEILPKELVPISGVVSWISNVLISNLTLKIIEAFGIFPLFLFFFCCCIIGFSILGLLAVETKGKTASQVYLEFQKKG